MAGLWRYPVKSMGAEALKAAEVGWHGIAGDRRWAFIRDGVERSGFPWLTLREQPAMRGYAPSFRDPSRPDDSVTVVRTPTGAELDVADQALASELGEGARVIKQDRGVFDTMPLSLITTQSIARIGALVDRDLAVQRFRPNVLIEAAGPDPFQEDAWVGSTLRIGGFSMRIDKRDQRCVVINIDPATHERDPAILRTVAAERDAYLGVYGSTIEPGTVAVGDPVSAAG